jgi:hypothetical protein
MSTNEVERRIQESLYLVIFMKRRAIEAAIICSAIEMKSAIRRTIVTKI